MLKPSSIRTVLKHLKEHYPNARTALDHKNSFELLIATILSAQCTDKRVNIITPALFKAYPDPESMAAASIKNIEHYIKTCGLYQAKAKNISKCCRQLLNDFNGEVPRTIKELQTLGGVGKKTANVVASVAFGVPAIAVDTHVFRVSNRIGLAHAKDVKRTEDQLMENIPKKAWADAHHWIIHHGREICDARSPKCDMCFLKRWCEYYKKNTAH